MRRLVTSACTLIGAVLALALLSCDGEVPAAPDAALLDSNLAAKANPAGHSVTGQATTWYRGPSGQEGWLHISLSARSMPDGSAKGNFHWQWRSRDPGGRIFVKVSCLTIVGNEAWMVGQATQAGNPDNVGKWMGLYAADNGEGASGSPDLIAQEWIGDDPAEAQTFCTGTPADIDSKREVEIGNIQIR